MSNATLELENATTFTFELGQEVQDDWGMVYVVFDRYREKGTGQELYEVRRFRDGEIDKVGMVKPMRLLNYKD